MGILDDLKKEADKLKAEQKTEQGEAARLEDVYKQKGRPHMKDIAGYLYEMIEQLKVVKLDVRADYDIPGIGLVKDLVQDDYRVIMDSKKSPRKVALQFICTTPTPGKYQVLSMPKADELRHFLQQQQIQFTEWGIRGHHDKLAGARFECQIQVRVKLVFTVDVEHERISLTTTNRHGLTMKNSHYGFAGINGKWMDELGHYILRKTEQLGTLDLTEDARQDIRDKVKQEQMQRAQELEKK